MKQQPDFVDENFGKNDRMIGNNNCIKIKKGKKRGEKIEHQNSIMKTKSKENLCEAAKLLKLNLVSWNKLF